MIAEKININKLPYRGLNKVCDLLTFERNYLSLFKNLKNEYFLLYLFDSHQTLDEYLFWKVELLDLYSFMNKRVSLKDLIVIDSKEFIFIIQSDYESIEDLGDEGDYLDIDQILLNEIDQEWLPIKESYWDYPIPELLVSTLENFARENYLEVLREKSIYFVLEPRIEGYSTTVSSADVANFLTLLNRSYLNFIAFDFRTKFPDLFLSEVNFQNSVEELKARLLPRVTSTKFGSFEVGLGVDSLHPILEGNSDFFKWQQSAIELYKAEVFNVDFELMKTATDFIEKYPLDVRKDIFNPLYEISNSQRYSVKSTNRLKSYFEELPPITKETKKTITYLEEETKEVDSEQLEFVTAVITVPTGGNISDLGKRALRKNLWAVTRSDTTELNRQESFTLKGKTFNAISHLPIRLATKNLINILLCDVFSIEVNAPDTVEIYSKLEKELYDYYFTKVINNPRSNEAKIFAIYFDVVGD